MVANQGIAQALAAQTRAIQQLVLSLRSPAALEAGAGGGLHWQGTGGLAGLEYAGQVEQEAAAGGLALARGKRWHFFVSHAQASGGDQANLICTNLEIKGCSVWYVSHACTMLAPTGETRKSDTLP